MFGFASFAELPICALPIAAPTPVIVVDTHDGEEKRKKKYAEEIEAKERKKAELKAIYEELVEGKPRVVEEIVAPYMVVTEDVKTATVKPEIDFDRLLNSLDTVQKLYREYQELDDEDVLLLI